MPGSACAVRITPTAVVKRWEEAIHAAVNDPEVSRKLLDNGLVPAFRTPPAWPAPWRRAGAEKMGDPAPPTYGRIEALRRGALQMNMSSWL